MSRIIYTSRERKFTPRKREHPRSIFMLVGFLLLCAGLVYATRMPLWQVRKFEIEAGEKISKDEISQKVSGLLSGSYVFVIPKSWFFLVSTETLQEELRTQNPLFAEVAMKKKFPDTLKISVSERTFFGILCNNQSFFKENSEADKLSEEEKTVCAYVDTSGFAYEEAPSSSGALIVRLEEDQDSFLVPKQAVDQELFRKIKILRDDLPLRIGERAVLFQLPVGTPREFKVKTSGGYMLWLNKSDDMDAVLKILKTVLDREVKGRRKNLAYIDLRFGNKVFFKFR